MIKKVMPSDRGTGTQVVRLGLLGSPSDPVHKLPAAQVRNRRHDKRQIYMRIEKKPAARNPFSRRPEYVAGCHFLAVHATKAAPANESLNPVFRPRPKGVPGVFYPQITQITQAPQMDTGFRIRNCRDFTGIPGKKEKFLQRQGGKGGDGWKCTALRDAADCGCSKSIDDLMTSWRCWGAERLRYRQAQLEMLFYLPMPFWTSSIYSELLSLAYCSPVCFAAQTAASSIAVSGLYIGL